MQKLLVILILLWGFHLASFAQKKGSKTQNVVLITLDGLRWQEVFGGIDSLLLHAKAYTPHPESLGEKYWADTPDERREKLMPFFWSMIAEKGQLHGNRWKGSKADCTNTMWFSYPGYNEILSGFADDERIHSNDKINNPNQTVLEFVNGQKGFRGKVTAFGSWDVFPFIINAERSGLPVNAGFPAKPNRKLSAAESLLYDLQAQIPAEWSSVRFDAFTHHFAKMYMQEHHPRVVYVSYGETDDFAHDGAYDHYIEAAHRTDAFIADLWALTQRDPFYAGKTTFLITTDHGRGAQPLETWKSHGDEITGAGQIWIAALGPDTPALGEAATEEQLHQNQIAQTLATLLGLSYKPEKKAGEALKSVIK